MRHDPTLLHVRVHRSHIVRAGLVLLGVVAVGVPLLLYAGSVGTLTSFSNGQVADAALVNANFSDLRTAINDNDARLTLHLGRDGTTPAKAAASCKAILEAFPSSANAAYFLDPDRDGDTSNAKSVYCDMTGGGWTLMAINRVDASTTLFAKDWATYKAGFGDVSSATASAGWIGNENIYRLTRDGTATLKVVTNLGTHYYPGWSVLGEDQEYRMFVPNSSSNKANADSGLRYAHGRRFSTFDRDNDEHASNCAGDQKTGWWFRGCWYTLYAANVASQSYWNEPDTGTQDFSTIALWLR